MNKKLVIVVNIFLIPHTLYCPEDSWTFFNLFRHTQHKEEPVEEKIHPKRVNFDPQVTEYNTDPSTPLTNPNHTSVIVAPLKTNKQPSQLVLQLETPQTYVPDVFNTSLPDTVDTNTTTPALTTVAEELEKTGLAKRLQNAILRNVKNIFNFFYKHATSKWKVVKTNDDTTVIEATDSDGTDDKIVVKKASEKFLGAKVEAKIKNASQPQSFKSMTMLRDLIKNNDLADADQAMQDIVTNLSSSSDAATKELYTQLTSTIERYKSLDGTPIYENLDTDEKIDLIDTFLQKNPTLDRMITSIIEKSLPSLQEQFKRWTGTYYEGQQAASAIMREPENNSTLFEQTYNK